MTATLERDLTQEVSTSRYQIMGVPRAKDGPTQSGIAVLTTLTDEEATDAQPGDLLLYHALGGVVPCEVIRSRIGVAYDESGTQPFDVPVLDIRFATHELAMAPGDLLTVSILEPEL